MAVRVIEVPRAHRPDHQARLPIPSMSTLARLFLSSDYQCRILLDDLAHRYTTGVIGGELRAAVERFAAAVGRHQALADDPAYRAARDDIEQLRQHLHRETQRCADRDHELARLRGEAAQIPGLQARVAELEAARTDTTGHVRCEADRQDRMPSALSRQQRRAAQRAAAKHH